MDIPCGNDYTHRVRGEGMDEAQAAEQLELAVAGDQDAMQRLIVHYHMPLRHKVAGRMDDAVRRQLDVDDILQEAYVAAFKALADQNRDRERAVKQRPNRERK
ncbi:MAG TPA: sigma factor, partial [Phycisphaerae bacterium]|nr:sigma factor [Phycisphaerae bacterium]